MTTYQSPRQHKSTAKIREHFLMHPGVVIFLSDLRDIAHATGEQLTDQQLRGVVNTSKWQGFEIQTVSRGQSWMYRPGVGNTVGAGILGQSHPRVQTYSELARKFGIVKDGERIEIDHEPSPASTALDKALPNINIPDINLVKTSTEQLYERLNAPSNSERLYREKMVTKSGDRILEDEDGILFRARELDLE